MGMGSIAVDGLSPADREKLDALVIGFRGYYTAADVLELAQKVVTRQRQRNSTWQPQNGDHLIGLVGGSPDSAYRYDQDSATWIKGADDSQIIELKALIDQNIIDIAGNATAIEALENEFNNRVTKIELSNVTTYEVLLNQFTTRPILEVYVDYNGESVKSEPVVRYTETKIIIDFNGHYVDGYLILK